MLFNYLKLCRFNSLGTTGVLATAGAVCILGTTFHIQILFLFILGVLGGAAGMVMNELCDVEVDRRGHHNHNIDKPLVTGEISIDSAFIFLIFIMFLFFLAGAYINTQTLPILVLVTLAGTLYNMYSKQSPLATGFLCMWLFTFILYSAMSISLSVPLVVYILAIYATLDILMLICEVGDLKDIETDSVNSAKAMGCRIDNGVLHLSNEYVVIFLGIHISEIYLLVWSTQFFIFNIYIKILLMILMTAYIGLHLGQTVYDNHAPYRRERMCRYAILRAFTSLILIAVFLIAIIGIEILILPLVAICWFFISNRVLFKRFSRGNW